MFRDVRVRATDAQRRGAPGHSGAASFKSPERCRRRTDAAEIAERDGGDSDAGKPGAMRSRKRRRRGAEGAAARTIWSPEPPAESKKAAADAEHADDDSGADAMSRHARLGEEMGETTAHLSVFVDLNGEARNGGAPCRRRRRTRVVAGEEGGRGRSVEVFARRSLFFHEIAKQSFSRVFLQFFGAKIRGGGDRGEPARPGGDRATWRATIGRKSSATVSRVLGATWTYLGRLPGRSDGQRNLGDVEMRIWGESFQLLYIVV